MEIQGTFEQKVLMTADGYIRKGRWTDAVQLIKYTEMIQDSSPNPVTSLLVSKILKDAICLADIHKTLKIYHDLKIVIEEVPSVSAADKCSVYNNLACTYRNAGNVIQAKKYAEKAVFLALTHKLPFVERAAIQLNFVSILSDTGKHEKAAEEALKVLDGFGKLSSLTEPMQRLFSNACFRYAHEKFTLKDLKESGKYFKKTIKLIEKLPDMSEMLKDAQYMYQTIQKEVYKKPKSRPVSANFKQKLNSRLDFVKNKQFEDKLEIVRNKQPEDSARSVNKKITQYVRPTSGSRFVSNEMLRYQKEIDKIISRPPLHSNKMRIHSDQLRISSQSGIRILPSRPDSGVSYFSPMSKGTSELSVETQQVVSLTRIENSSMMNHLISFDHSFNSPLKPIENFDIGKEIEENIKQESAALKIQAWFRGLLTRRTQMSRKSIEVLLSCKKIIKGKLFFVIVVQVKKMCTIEILDLKSLTVVLKDCLSNDQIENIDKLVQGIDLDGKGVPVIGSKGQSGCFKHVQRSVKKVGEENLILDCFSNEKNEVLIKAKSFKSQKEFSVKVKRSTGNLREEIEERIIPKLKLKEQVLVLSESLDYVPELMWEGDKCIELKDFHVCVYLKNEKFIVFAKEKDRGSLSELEIQPLRPSKSQAKIVWEKVWVQDDKIMLKETEEKSEEFVREFEKFEVNNELLAFERKNEDLLTEKLISEEKNFYKEFKETKEIFEENKEVSNKLHDLDIPTKPIQIFELKSEINPQDDEILNKDNKIIFVKCDSNEDKENTYQDLKDNAFSNNKESNVAEKLKKCDERVDNWGSKENMIKSKPEDIQFNSKESKETKSKDVKYMSVVVDVSAPENQYADSTYEVQEDDEDSIFDEKMRFSYESQVEIAKQPYKIQCQVYSTFLCVLVTGPIENYTIYLNSLIIKGYPEDCPLKQILNQYVFPRLYFKDLGNSKILTCSKKFLIETPEKLLKTDSNLLLEFNKTLENQEFKIKILKNKNFYLVLSMSKNTFQRFWLPFKETKNFPEDSVLCSYISSQVQLINSEKLGIYEMKGKSLYSVFNYEISGQEFAVIVKKEDLCCFVEVHRPKSKIYSTMYVEGPKFKAAQVFDIAKSLRLIEIRGEFSLISDLV